jgi:hypothetical protein
MTEKSASVQTSTFRTPIHTLDLFTGQKLKAPQETFSNYATDESQCGQDSMLRRHASHDFGLCLVYNNTLETW